MFRFDFWICFIFSMPSLLTLSFLCSLPSISLQDFSCSHVKSSLRKSSLIDPRKLWIWPWMWCYALYGSLLLLNCSNSNLLLTILRVPLNSLFIKKQNKTKYFTQTILSTEATKFEGKGSGSLYRDLFISYLFSGMSQQIQRQPTKQCVRWSSVLCYIDSHETKWN